MSTLITDVETNILAVLAALTVDGAPIAAYDYEPGPEGFQLPCATLFMPDLERPALSVAESQMGTDDWDMTWTLRLYVELVNAQRSQTQLKLLVADLILAIDTDQTLGGLMIDARIEKATSGVVQDDKRERQILTYECELAARRFVDTLYP